MFSSGLRGSGGGGGGGGGGQGWRLQLLRIRDFHFRCFLWTDLFWAGFFLGFV